MCIYVCVWCVNVYDIRSAVPAEPSHARAVLEPSVLRMSLSHDSDTPPGLRLSGGFWSNHWVGDDGTGAGPLWMEPRASCSLATCSTGRATPCLCGHALFLRHASMGCFPASHDAGQDSEVSSERRRPSTERFCRCQSSSPSPSPEDASQALGGRRWFERQGPCPGEAGKSPPGLLSCACLCVMANTESQGRILDQV